MSERYSALWPDGLPGLFEGFDYIKTATDQEKQDLIDTIKPVFAIMVEKRDRIADEGGMTDPIERRYADAGIYGALTRCKMHLQICGVPIEEVRDIDPLAT